MPYGEELENQKSENRKNIILGALIGFVVSFGLWSIQTIFSEMKNADKEKSIRINYISDLEVDALQNLDFLKAKESNLIKDKLSYSSIVGYCAQSAIMYANTYHSIFKVQDFAVRNNINVYCANAIHFDMHKNFDDKNALTTTSIINLKKETETLIAILYFAETKNYNFDFSKEEFNDWLKDWIKSNSFFAEPIK
jgi:hypothetical protein